jgi:hypothetical protein
MENESKDALDEVVWDHVVRMVRAAHGLSHADYMARATELGRESLPRQKQASLYVWYLLRNAVGEIIEWRVPSDEDLQRISHAYFGGFRALVGRDESTFEDLLLRVWERPRRAGKMSFGDLAVLGAAAIGILYQDPDKSLAWVRPRLNTWWLKSSDKYLKNGPM